MAGETLRFKSHRKQLTGFCVASFQMSADLATDHVNGNGTEEPMETMATVTRSEHFQALLDSGLSQNVAEKLDELYVAGQDTHTHTAAAVPASCSLGGNITDTLSVFP